MAFSPSLMFSMIKPNRKEAAMAEPALYEKLAEKIFCKGSKRVPRRFQMVADEQGAALMLALPATAAEAAQKLGRDAPEAEQALETLFQKGVVFKSKKPEGTKYRMCRDLAQFHDASILWSEATREFHDLWQRYMEEEGPGYARFVSKGLQKPFPQGRPGRAGRSRSRKLWPLPGPRRNRA